MWWCLALLPESSALLTWGVMGSQGEILQRKNHYLKSWRETLLRGTSWCYGVVWLRCSVVRGCLAVMYVLRWVWGGWKPVLPGGKDFSLLIMTSCFPFHCAIETHMLTIKRRMNLHSSPLLLCGPFGSWLTGLLESSEPKMQLRFSVSHAFLPGPVIATIGQV